MLAGLIHTPIARALGWALVHFLWEGALIAGLVGLALLLARPASARVRYAAACLAMAAMAISFAVTVVVLWPAPAPALAHAPPVSRAMAPSALAVPLPPASPPPDRLPWVVPFWMAGVLVFYVRTAGGWLAAQRLRGRGAVAASPEWQVRLRALAARLRVTRPVLLLESCLAETPVVMGFLRPSILIPAGLLAGLPADQLEAILLHELMHIRRYDYAVNVLQSMIEGLLFYHPAVWWVSGLVRAERENCCDDAVVALRGDARGYAAALAALEQRRSAGQPALAASGGNLMRRIRRLIEPERERPVAGPVFGACLLLVSIAVGLSALQPPAKPAAKVGQALPPANSLPVFKTGTQASPPPLLARSLAPPEAAPAQLRAELQTPYRKWLNEDVFYIITDEERSAFVKLQTDEEREQFIEQFWLRRDPAPDTPVNEFKEEHYRRIAYANEHFAARVPGWSTDRGKVYIQYGPPNEIEDHSTGGAYQRPPQEGGGATSAFPFQIWRYRYIEGIGTNVIIEFVDPAMTGDFHMTMDPSEKDALLRPPNSGPAIAATSQSGLRFSIVRGPVLPGGMLRTVTVSVSATADGHRMNIQGRITLPARPYVAVFEDTITGRPDGVYQKVLAALPPGSYQAQVTVTDLDTGATETGDLQFSIPSR